MAYCSHSASEPIGVPSIPTKVPGPFMGESMGMPGGNPAHAQVEGTCASGNRARAISGPCGSGDGARTLLQPGARSKHPGARAAWRGERTVVARLREAGVARLHKGGGPFSYQMYVSCTGSLEM